jgi:hypothetical protein
VTETSKTALEPTIAYEGNCALKMELGDSFKIAPFVTEETIASCENIIQKATDDFFIKLEPDFRQLQFIASSIGDPISDEDIYSMQILCYNIKNYAKVLGFTLITEICIHVTDAVNSPKLPFRIQHALIQNMIGVLRIAFDQKIQSDGGNTGQEILNKLKKFLP